MPETLYYVNLDGEYFGPFTLATISGMQLTPDVSVFSSATNEWREAYKYEELVNSLDLSTIVPDYGPPTLPVEQAASCVPPTVNDRTVFYLRRGGTPYGPYTVQSLATVPLSDETYVSADGMTTWFKPAEIPGLINLIACRRPKDDGQVPHSTDEMALDMTAISGIINEVQRLLPEENRLYHRVFESREAEQAVVIAEYETTLSSLVDCIDRLCRKCRNVDLSKRFITMVTHTINEVTGKLREHYTAEFERLGFFRPETSTAEVAIGSTVYTPLPPFDGIEVNRIDFLKVLADKNLCVTYRDGAREKAYEFVNSVVGRLLGGNPARSIEIDVIDTERMTGLDDSFKLLNRDLYRVISRPEGVKVAVASLLDRVSSILRNLLVENGTSLHDYNCTHDNKEPYHLLVVMGLRGLNADTLAMMERLAAVGPQAGIYTVIVVDEAELDTLPERITGLFDIDAFAELSNNFTFNGIIADIFSAVRNGGNNGMIESESIYSNLTSPELKQIVLELNARCTLREDVMVSIGDYLPAESQWWKGESSRLIGIPFGLGNDMNCKSLKITQESGQNSAVVIGIPGSGKSVFLHSLICSAAVRYSPDQLRMYLIDFSGVEFNSYALGKLPHARVIAPEAEREFGLSILNELVEEGARRMNLCREHNVSNIVDLRRVAPDIMMPRLLVVIDEFQKLFEIENDLISREANSKIHIIIQEFRKFGINLILATQKLPSGTLLPRDLIANRIVFKSSPADFSALITTEAGGMMPRLRTGQCIYNSESGAAYDNEKVQCYYVSKNDIDELLSRLAAFEKHFSYEREPLKVFRSAEQPDFGSRRILPMHRAIARRGAAIPVYVGESISVNDYDVNFELRHEGANNMLIIGGDSDVAETICFHSLLSVSTSHGSGDASMVVINGMRADNPLREKMMNVITGLPFDTVVPTDNTQVEQTLTAIKESIDSRRASADTGYANIYLGIFDFQNCRAFDRDTGGRIEKPSMAATLLEYILRNGPAVGVFTLLQVDSLDNLSRAGSLLSTFNYRVALQMPEMESNKVVGLPAANRLFIFNRPASKYRAYLRDNTRNTLVKFKPYKLS